MSERTKIGIRPVLSLALLLSCAMIAIAQRHSYETRLTRAEEIRFQYWKSIYAPNDSGVDYDLRGAFKARLKPDSRHHWPDRFKKPNHPTFSVESQYARGKNRAKAGHWQGETFIPAKGRESQ